MADSVNEMRSRRSGFPEAASNSKTEKHTAQLPSGTTEKHTHQGIGSSVPDFQDASSFMGGQVDGELGPFNVGVASVQKGESSPSAPKLQKGSPNP